MRKVKNFRAGDIDVSVEFDPDIQEYVVRQFHKGFENRDAKYYTDDKEDAISTARHIFKSFVIGE